MKWLTEDFLKNFEIEFRAFKFNRDYLRSDDPSIKVLSTDYSIKYWKEKGLERVAHILHGWRLCKSEIRNQKLNSIGI
jgi:hypothetical protein